MKKLYKARWYSAVNPTISCASVDFYATSDSAARLRADKIARELQVSGARRDITCDGRTVESFQPNG